MEWTTDEDKPAAKPQQMMEESRQNVDMRARAEAEQQR
jgi:hypothetical protein